MRASRQINSRPAVQKTVSVETEARLVSSATIAEIVRGLIGGDWKVSGLLDRVSVDSAPETLILDISFTAADSTTAAQGARAFANAYLEYKRDGGRLLLVTQRENLQHLIDDARNGRSAEPHPPKSSPHTARFLNAQAERDTLNGQIALLTAQMAQIPFTVDPA